jgi:hypothetical protein
LSFCRRMVAVVAAPALLVGLLLAASAGSTPALSYGSEFGSVSFTALVIPGTTTFTITSTTCTLHEDGHSGKVACFLSGAGTYNNQGNIATADVAITSSFGPISLDFPHLHTSCSEGTGVAITKTGPVPVVAIIGGPVKANAAGVVTDLIEIYNTGNTSTGC